MEVESPSKADVVVGLEVPEVVRRQRIGARKEWTAEDQAIVHDEGFNERLRAGYRALCTSMNANRPVDVIVDDIVGKGR